MDFWLSWVSLGIIFIIIELFLLTLDFLALGVSAILTGIIIYVFDIPRSERWIAVFVYLVIGIIALLVTRGYILPRWRRTGQSQKTLTIDKLVGEKLIIQNKNDTNVVYFEGIYRNITNKDEFKAGDMVEIIEVKGHKVKVSKI